MANTDTLAPSDILTSASDDSEATLAAVRGQALAASGDKREMLFDLFDQPSSDATGSSCFGT